MKNKKYNKEQRNFVEKEKISGFLTCTICQEIFDDPYRVTCGHTFCCKCLEKWHKNNINNPTCPLCRENYEPDYTGKDLIAQSIINELQVYCINNGCPWKGKLSELQNHIKSCLFCPKNMPNFIKIELQNKNKNKGSETIELDENAEEIIGKTSSFNIKSSLKERIYSKNPSLVKKIFENQSVSYLENKEENKEKEKISNQSEINELYEHLFHDSGLNFISIKTQRDNKGTEMESDKEQKNIQIIGFNKTFENNNNIKKDNVVLFKITKNTDPINKNEQAKEKEEEDFCFFHDN